ncbi:hypothetical protein EV360DRAFT_83454 [Lentinula raphanica]|nr:hypothetical protein EV360DRAFT_83454 [Lentinula raphanica]
MGMDWAVYNIDKQTVISQPKLHEFFWFPYDSQHPSSESDITTNLLTTPIIPSCFKPKSSLLTGARVQNAKISAAPAVTTLLSLPPELLLAVAEELAEDYLDLIFFSTTCATMWELTQPIRYRVICSEIRAKSWAGCRVVLIGGTNHTLPHGMLTDGEKEYFRRCIRASGEWIEEYELDTDNVNLSVVPCWEGSLDLPKISPRYSSQRLRNNRSQRQAVTSLFHVFGRWLSFDWREFMPNKEEGDNWMIRNFTKREYVISVRHLTQMLYSLTGFFSDAFSEESEWYAHGDWAGDRIDITLTSMHKQEHGDESDWKDITEGIRKKLNALCQSSEGPQTDDEFQF